MAKKNFNKHRLTEILSEYAEPAEMPKKVYNEPKPETKIIDRAKLEGDLADLLYSAGGQASGYRRQLNKILDQYL